MGAQKNQFTVVTRTRRSTMPFYWLHLMPSLWLMVFNPGTTSNIETVSLTLNTWSEDCHVAANKWLRYESWKMLLVKLRFLVSEHISCWFRVSFDSFNESLHSCCCSALMWSMYWGAQYLKKTKKIIDYLYWIDITVLLLQTPGRRLAGKRAKVMGARLQDEGLIYVLAIALLSLGLHDLYTYPPPPTQYTI